MTPEERKIYQKEYYSKNREKVLEDCRNYRNSKKDDPLYKEKKKEWNKKQDSIRKNKKDRIEWKLKSRKLEGYKSKELEYRKSKRGKFSSYKKNSKRRNLEFSLTFEEFISFWNVECFYCGDSIETIGIDRVNNSLGYVLENIIPCCKVCNFMKGKMSQEKFLRKICEVLHNSQNRKVNVHGNYNKWYRTYKYCAKKRELSFNLDKMQFESITSNNCFYCGTIEYIGVDRLNNNVGYEYENCVPCCKECNFMKGELNFDKFYSHLTKIKNRSLRPSKGVQLNENL